MAEEKNTKLVHHLNRTAFSKETKDRTRACQILDEDYKVLWRINKESTLYNSELKYYEETFGRTVAAINQKHKANRHKSRIISIESLYLGRRTCPETITIRLSGEYDTIAPEQFLSCIEEYIAWMRYWSAKHGNCITILNVMNSKNDPMEVIIRRIYTYRDKTGLIKLCQSKALKNAGILPPDPSKEESRTNNPKITFDRMSREMLIGICKKNHISVNEVPQIYTLDQALKIAAQVEAERKELLTWFNDLMKIERGWPEEVDYEEIILDNGNIMLSAENFRILKIRSALSRPYGINLDATTAKYHHTQLKWQLERAKLAELKEQLEFARNKRSSLLLGLDRCGFSYEQVN